MDGNEADNPETAFPSVDLAYDIAIDASRGQFEFLIPLFSTSFGCTDRIGSSKRI